MSEDITVTVTTPEGTVSAPITTFAHGQLKSIVERIERMEEEKKSVLDDIKDIYAEAKSAGFDAKALRGVIRERKQEQTTLEEYIALVDLYRRALGMDPIGL
jgi:uncharacterized protein (UPF0335 family)